MRGRARPRWPEGKAFAFTVVDDTDDATLRRVRPIYSLLADLGLFTTKTVWPLSAPDDPRWRDTDTLEVGDYRDFILRLQEAGFEIGLHGVRGASSTRETILRGLDRYVELLGRPPRIHINHSRNADNLYWGEARLPPWRRATGLHRRGPQASEGHVPSSPHFWGDLCRSTIDYVRALSFTNIDTLESDPYMPYHDGRFPFVNAWFSCSDGADIGAFRRLMSRTNIRRLADQGGACIVYAHFGKPGFVDDNGEVVADVRDTLASLSREDGWFRPASDILDHLRGERVRRLTGLQRLRLETRARIDRLFAPR